MQKDDLLRLMRDPNLIPSEKQTLLSNIASQAASLNMPCYVVGGFVRDLLLGKPINDLDIIVEGDAIKLGKKLVEVYGGKLTPHFKFHTAIWHLPENFNLQPATLDLITARKETYEKPGALPTVTPATIEDDLRRRDFTINAMAIRLDGEAFGEIHDPLEGQADLKQRVIRVLHPQSFIDDPTRIFRAIRYEVRYGFSMDAMTLDLVNSEALKILHSLSGERLRHELDLFFDEDQAVEMIWRAGGLGLLHSIHPKMPEFTQEYVEFLEMDMTLDVQADRQTTGFILWFMSLSEEDVILLSNRLSFTNELTLAVWAGAQLKRGLPHLIDLKPSEWVYTLEKLPLLSIYAVYLVSGENALLSYISIWRHVKPHTTGNDLKELGLPAGPRFGEILLRLRSAWLDGEVSNESQEKELLTKLL
ncbi:MAG: CCA tRNA nucleotidyltransferase [Anaerolineales bacterium]|nr:CCA tRNA nucleotidyltransferase [Anaerolineales bacterium]MCB9143793.1 CCA tRNA nucleotidyltransferase [Anaerolineales bacterium]